MTLATKITILRIGFIPVYMLFAYLSGGNQGLWMFLALGIFILASVTDYLDGYIARKYDQVSDLGKFLDPLADKMLTITAMTMFCQWGKFPAWALVIVLTREFAVSGLRMVAAGKGSVIAAAWSGKIKTACTMIGLCLLMAFPDFVWLQVAVMLVIVVTTVSSGVEYFIRNGHCLK